MVPAHRRMLLVVRATCLYIPSWAILACGARSVHVYAEEEAGAACVDGDRRCVGVGIEECISGGFHRMEDCPEECVRGQCLSECEAIESRLWWTTGCTFWAADLPGTPPVPPELWVGRIGEGSAEVQLERFDNGEPELSDVTHVEGGGLARLVPSAGGGASGYRLTASRPVVVTQLHRSSEGLSGTALPAADDWRCPGGCGYTVAALPPGEGGPSEAVVVAADDGEVTWLAPGGGERRAVVRLGEIVDLASSKEDLGGLELEATSPLLVLGYSRGIGGGVTVDPGETVSPVAFSASGRHVALAPPADHGVAGQGAVAGDGERDRPGRSGARGG